jgi:succinate dehydrogenase/fumarate reductase-like Fe-S protein
VLNISREDAAKGKCIECLACETECVTKGKGGAFIDLPIEGLDAWRAAARSTPAAPAAERTKS